VGNDLVPLTHVHPFNKTATEENLLALLVDTERTVGI
jgi:hypothetical protein